MCHFREAAQQKLRKVSSLGRFPSHVINKYYVFSIAEQWKNISELAISFIHKMLTYNPENRISAQEALLDPWIILNIGTKKKVEEASAIQSFNCLRKFSVS